MKTNLITVKPGKKIRLRDVDADAIGEYKSKEEVVARMAKLHEKLSELQEMLYAEDKQSLLVVLQAMDTGGKDGALRSLMTGVNPAGVQVTSFKAPSVEEMQHDFLWRTHKAVPPRGIIGVWNRSHYEEVLIVRVHQMVEKKVWQSRYDDINSFETLLVDNNVKMLKFYLHISKDEQKKRLQSRLDNPDKNWKFSTGDLTERKLWDDYQDAFEDAINKCSTEAAPWMIVPANHKWARNIALAEAVVAALEKMNPRYPKVDFDPKSIVID